MNTKQILLGVVCVVISGLIMHLYYELSTIRKMMMNPLTLDENLSDDDEDDEEGETTGEGRGELAGMDTPDVGAGALPSGDPL